MPTTASTSSAHQEYKIVYSIRDGEHEYDAYIIARFDHEPTTLECAIAVIDEYMLDEQNRKEALREYAEEGYFVIPGDYRSVSDFGAVPYITPSIAFELLEQLQVFVDMAHSVSGNWENGDLAKAVQNLVRVANESQRLIAKAKGR